jgi:hypothetical protein
MHGLKHDVIVACTVSLLAALLVTSVALRTRQAPGSIADTALDSAPEIASCEPSTDKLSMPVSARFDDDESASEVC